MVSPTTRRRLYGSMAFVATAFTMSQAAQAQDCGPIPVGGSVVCAPSGNPYADGIFYVAFGDATINLDPGVSVIDTSDVDSPGLFAIIGDDGNLTINGGTDTLISTTGNNAVGVQAFTNAGQLSVTLDRVSTEGTGGGIQAGASDGDVSVTANSVTTLGTGADAVEVTTNSSDVTVDVGTVSTAGDGANGVRARSDFGNVSVTADSITTTGNQSGFIDPGANGILAQTGGAGTVTIDAGTIDTSGTGAFGIRATNNTGAMLIDADSVTTAGDGAEAISVLSAGAVDINAGTISTSGTGANGIQAQSSGSVAIDFDSVTTTGDNSVGVLVPQGAVFFGPRATPNVTITGGDVSTSGLNSDGVRAIASTGTASVALDGTVTTLGDGSRGIVASGDTAATVTGPVDVSTSGMNAAGVVLTSPGAINFANADGSITTTGDASDGLLVTGTVGPVTIDAGMIDVSGAGSTAINSTTTTGSQTILANAAITSENGDGIRSTSTDGDLSITTGADLAASGTGISALASGTGDIAVTTGGNVSAMTGAGILASQTGLDGDVVINTAAGTTIRATTVGVEGMVSNPLSDGSVTINNNAAIASPIGAPNTLGTGIYASTTLGQAQVNNTGAIGASGDAVQFYGIVADVQDAASTASSIVNNTGAIYSAGIGIDVMNAGSGLTTATNGAGLIQAAGTGIAATGTTGQLTVTTGTGTVTSTAGRGISTSNTTGATTITTGTGAVNGAITGIQAVSTGTQTITANGAVSGGTTAGIHSDTTANRTINVGTGGNVTGGAEAILLTNTGTATINNNGTIGASPTGLAVMASTAGATTVNNGTSTTAGGTLNGRLTFGAGNDTLSNYGTFNTQGTTDFGAGTDALINRSSGVINLTGATTFANLESFTQGGRLNLNNYTLTGSGAFTNAAGATLDTSGAAGLAGFTSFSNAGTLDLAPGVFTAPAGAFTNSGTIIADEGASTITGQTSFTNTGLINLVDNAANDTLTINSSFIGGTGSRLAVDVSDTMADRLVVTGAISGSTAVDANLLGTGVLAGGGVQFVDGQSTSTPNAFTLGNVVGGSALVNYSVVQQGSDYYLGAALNQAGFRPLSLAAAVPDFWYPSADEIIANLAVPYKGEGIGFWADGYYSRQKYGDRNTDYSFGGVDYTVDQRVKLSHMGLQGGVDFGMGDTGRVGVTAGYSKHEGKGSTDLDAKGWNVGLYGAFGGPVGFHGEALAKYDRYKVDFNDNFFSGYDPKVKAFGLDGSIGYRIPMAAELSSIDLAAGVSHVTSKIEDIRAYGITYDYDRVKSTRGRASARYNLGGDIQPYVQATAYHEFAKPGRVGLFDGVDNYSLATAKRGTWGRIEGGIGGSPSRFPSFAAWADFGDVKGIGARLGMRFGGRVAPAPEPLPAPAPAPAPEPAPATQTCYDGSVILATDTCPLPPAPPPPAPAPERG